MFKKFDLNESEYCIFLILVASQKLFEIILFLYKKYIQILEFSNSMLDRKIIYVNISRSF